MLHKCPDKLICDLAQTYHITGYKSLPARTTAIFLCGLDDKSRVKMYLSGQYYSLDTMLMAAIYDKLQWLCWSYTEDGQNNVNLPQSVCQIISGNADLDDLSAYDSGEDFDRQRNMIISEVVKCQQVHH